MTPDEPRIPGFDQVARAARLGLWQLADSSATSALSWRAVQAGARRVQRRRLSAIGAGCAMVLVSGGAAFAMSGRDDGGNLRVSEPGASSSTTIDATTTAPQTSSTTNDGGITASTGATTTSIGRHGVKALDGTLTLASSTWVAEQPASFTLTVRNPSDQDYRVGPEMTLGIVVYGVGSGGCIGVDHADLVLAAGEQRTWTAAYTPRPDMIGKNEIGVAVLWAGDSYSNCLGTDGVAGVPVVPVTIVPPGWSEGQPLDASQGRWSATLAADQTTLSVGESTPIHVEVSNTGDQSQRTDGYGSLAVVCYAPGIEDGYPVFLPSTTVGPGTRQSFTVMFPFDKMSGPGTARCSLGIAFHGVVNVSSSVIHIDTGYLGIEVDPVPESTTTATVPETTTVATTP